MSNDNTLTLKTKLFGLLKKIAATLGVIAVKTVASIALATLTAIMGFVLAYAAALLVPGAFFLAPLAVAKIGGTVGLLTRIYKEAA